MSYCTQVMVEDEIYSALLYQMKQKLGGDFDAFIAKHMGAADAYVDSRLSGAFSMPLTDPPEVIQYAAAKMAAYFAIAKFTEKEEMAADKRDIAASMIQALAKSGKLPGSDVPVISQSIKFASDDQIFTNTELARW